MAEEYRRHDISDRIWELLKPHLPGRLGAWGRVAQDNIRFINAVIWILRTGATAGFASILWGLEEYSSQLLQMEG